MNNYEIAQRTYDNQVPDWYWWQHEKERNAHPDEDRLQEMEYELHHQWMQQDISENDLRRKYLVLDKYREGELTLLELNEVI
jgi:hypothetical protein